MMKSFQDFFFIYSVLTANRQGRRSYSTAPSELRLAGVFG